MDSSQLPLLLVDDDPLNLEILVDHLEDAGYATLTASSGEEAWDILQNENQSFQAVLLDRMMPGMNGMEVLAKIKSRESLDLLPVIMQTAAASPQEIREGIEAGAFYYLTKPFSKEVLLAIVESAVRDFTKYEDLQQKVTHQSEIFRRLDSAQFHFQTLEEASTLALLLANACPEPGRVVTGLTDMLLNAVEHGNLQVTYDEKTEFQKMGIWEEEINRRLTLPEYSNKWATVAFQRTPETIHYTITDAGQGFDWKDYIEVKPERAFLFHGRGIAMARAVSFDSVEYLGVGNQVVCTVNLTTDSSGAPPKKEPSLAMGAI